ncbi:MAG TPA: TetR/AcrR family transcriptional regulator [Candidatus Methanofastidiosa archaeon]|nr:TetR/AcrR family transcriptional regulator [Candidatus Methanofastidiosa archaeon]HPR42031.1 TetR/AcrR family transcriptional regulator [Candidatus Methanofastidiosa archaeon]
MARTVKDPEERRNEILDAAEELFVTKGYEATSIKDIIKKIDVAHGLFYYYFSSKEDVLNSIVIRYWDTISKRLSEIACDENKGPVEKIEEMFLEGVLMKKERMDILSNVLRTDNPLFMNKIIRYGIDMFVPILVVPVKEGIRQGIFHVDYPEYVLEMHFIGSSYSFDVHSLREGFDQYKIKLILMFDMLERMLGAKDGTFNNIKSIMGSMVDEIIEKYYSDFLNK